MDPEHESEEPMHPTKEKIALLNDKARTGRLPGSTKMMLTRMVAALPEETLAHLRCAVASFDAFTEDNDPYRERDFGALELEGERYFWKIDYYDRTLRFGGERAKSRKQVDPAFYGAKRTSHRAWRRTETHRDARQRGTVPRWFRRRSTGVGVVARDQGRMSSHLAALSQPLRIPPDLRAMSSGIPVFATPHNTPKTNTNLTGTCPHRRVHGSSLHII